MTRLKLSPAAETLCTCEDGQLMGVLGSVAAKIVTSAPQISAATLAQLLPPDWQPRVRANLIMITDGKSNQAKVFEFTGKSLGVRGLQDNGVLYATNHIILPDIADKQAQPLDALSVSRFDRLG